MISAQFLLDSESSISSDFKRMGHDDQVTQVWTQATINNVMPNQRMITITHEPIPEWEWPVMTMDLIVTENVLLDEVKRNQVVHLQLDKTADNNYLISEIHIIDSSEPAKPLQQENMNMPATEAVN